MKFSKKAKALIVAGFIAVGTATPAHAVDLAGSGASFVDPLLSIPFFLFENLKNLKYLVLGNEHIILLSFSKLSKIFMINFF